jgi:Tfp pilus assembly PilM family ATPase
MPFSFFKGKGRKIRRAVGLDIGSHSVKMVVLSGAPAALALSDCAVSSTEPASENPLPADVLTQKILDIVERNDLDVSDLRVSVSGRGAIVRHVEMPRMSPEELKSGIRYEAEVLLPFSLDDCIFDCQIRDPEDKDSAKMRVVLAAARKAVVHERLELLKGIGLSPRIVSIDSIALANAFERAVTGPPGAAVAGAPAPDSAGADFHGEHDLQYDDLDLTAHDGGQGIAYGKDRYETASRMTGSGSNETSLAVHVGAARTIVNAMSAAGLEFTRDVEVGGNNATLAIARGLGIEFQEAERRKHDGDAATREFIASMVMILARELRSTCSYVTSKMHAKVGKIFLSGGGALCQGVGETLSSETGVEVLFWNPLKGIPAAAGATPEETSGREAILAVATGLALAD